MKRKDIIKYAKEVLHFRVLEYPERVIAISPISVDCCLILEDDEFFDYVMQMKEFDEDDNVIILPEVQKTLKLGDFSNYGKELSNYTSGNIKYWLNEIARNHTSNNYMDCLEWLKEFHNVSAFELAIEQEKITIENFDLYTAILAAQRIQTFDDLEYNKDDILLNYAIDYLINIELIEELDAKTFNLIKESIKLCDSLEELREKINTILNDGEVITINIHQ